MKNTVNERVSTLLKTLNLDRFEIAKRAEIDPSTVFRIISGETKPSKSTLQSICNATGASYDYLLTGKGEMFEKKEPINPWKDALVEQLKEENNRLVQRADDWRARYDQLWNQFEFLLKRMPGDGVLGKLVPNGKNRTGKIPSVSLGQLAMS